MWLAARAYCSEKEPNMIPLIVLVIATIVARLLGLAVESLNGWVDALRIGFAAMFAFTAMAHFHPKLRPGILSMVPDNLPRRELLVTLTGVAELAGAIGLLIPAVAPFAATALALLLVAMFPANIHAHRHPTRIGNVKTTPFLPRVILQILFCALLLGISFA